MGALSWPEEALRANIIAQVSLALNRIWTEWYPSRGYSFNITGSPGYDQAYVNGRTVFAVMERLTAELFNTFVQRSGDAEPYFTEYCDGKTVTCPGMKQWGTVDRAREGMNALQILRYYYGNRVQLVTTDNIAAIPSSYPGSPLRRGSTGTNVRILQKQLSRIAKDYPSFGKPAVTGTFDEATENSVKKFQKQFSLTADGVVGRATWNKVSFIYVSVKDLAELTSEGETAEGTQSTGGWPGTVLRRGSTGSSVEQVQFWLSDLAQFDSSLVRVTVDGSYGAATERAVRAFQQKQSLTADGAVGQRTWNTLYAAWVDAQSDLGGRCRHGGAACAVLAAAGGGQLQRTAHRDRGRQLRRGDGQRGGGISNTVWADVGRRRRAQHVEQAEGGRAGRGEQNCGRQRRARAVHDHHAGGQQRHRRAGRAILPAAAGGLLQRCAARGRGRKIRRGDDAGR